MTDKPLANDWLPITDIQALKRLGKLAEESGELTAACSRCIIQGIDEREPTTGKLNREWLEDEIADVLTNIDIAVEYFGLDRSLIHSRMQRKRKQLEYWHGLPIADLQQHGKQCTAAICATDDSEDRRLSYQSCGCNLCVDRLAQ